MIKSPQESSTPQQKPNKIIQIEFCCHCDTHLFLVKHQAIKYLKHFEQIKKQLEQKDYIVKKKAVPDNIYKNSPYCPPNLYYHNQTNQIVYFPSIGSFEIYYHGKKIYSKLQNLKWPTLQAILPLIQNLQHQQLQKKKQTHLAQKIDRQNILKQQESYDHHLKKRTFHIKTKFEGQKMLHRYSVEKRNLFIKPSTNYTSRRNHSYKISSIRESLAENSLKVSHSINQQKPSNQNHLSQQPNLINPISEALDSVDKNQEIQLKTSNKKPSHNIYLQPLFPKTSVNLQNFNKQKMIFSNKIHQQKLRYDEQKIKKQQAIRLKKIEEQNKQKLRLQQESKDSIEGRIKGISFNKKNKQQQKIDIQKERVEAKEQLKKNPIKNQQKNNGTKIQQNKVTKIQQKKNKIKIQQKKNAPKEQQKNEKKIDKSLTKPPTSTIQQKKPQTLQKLPKEQQKEKQGIIKKQMQKSKNTIQMDNEYEKSPTPKLQKKNVIVTQIQSYQLKQAVLQQRQKIQQQKQSLILDKKVQPQLQKVQSIVKQENKDEYQGQFEQKTPQPQVKQQKQKVNQKNNLPKQVGNQVQVQQPQQQKQQKVESAPIIQNQKIEDNQYIADYEGANLQAQNKMVNQVAQQKQEKIGKKQNEQQKQEEGQNYEQQFEKNEQTVTLQNPETNKDNLDSKPVIEAVQLQAQRVQ